MREGFGAILFFGRPEYYPQFGFKEAEFFGIADAEGYNYPSFMAMELKTGYLNDACGGRFFESDIYHSISFPLISSSIFGGDLPNPVAESTKQCLRAYKKFVEDYPDYTIDVKLCAYTATEMQKAKQEYDKTEA